MALLNLAAEDDKLSTSMQERVSFHGDVALGVGFPLLFGGGPVSILGSAAGSFAFKGFGGQIYAVGIGQAIVQLQHVRSAYSGSDEAKIATDKLTSLGAAGSSGSAPQGSP